MMAAAGFCAATTRNLAYTTTRAQMIPPLKSAEYTLEEYNKSYKSIVQCARQVPTTLAGGKVGHVYLVTDKEGLRKATKDPSMVQDEVDQPDPVAEIASNDSHATIAHKRDLKIKDLSIYYTQEGCKAGLIDNIVDNVNPIVIS